jgi:hypothetical protein
VLPGLAAGAGRTIAVDATAAAGFSDTVLTCFYAFATPGDTTRPPRSPSSPPPTAGASFCEQRGVMKGAPVPLPIGAELQGPADTRVGAKATYTVTVTSHARTTIRDAAIGISQQYAGSHPPLRTIPVTTDWPDTRTSKSGDEEALLTQLRPGQTVVFHVTMRAPGPLLTTSGKPVYGTSFRVTASRRSLPGELLAAVLLSRLRR